MEKPAAVLDAEVRIGELTSRIPKVSGGDHGNQYTGGKKDTAVHFAKQEEPPTPQPAAPIVTEPRPVTQPTPAPEPPKAFFMASEISDN